MLRLCLIILILIQFNVFASLITTSNIDVSEIKHILSMNNQHYSARYQTVMGHIEEGRILEAKKSLAYLLTENPNDTVALDISGNILLAENKIYQALHAFQRAIKTNPSPEIMAKLGVCNLLVDKPKEARMWLTQALSISPGNQLSLRYLAWLEAKSLNKGAQLRYLSSLITLNSNENALYEYHIEYLTLLSESNNVVQALNFIEKNRGKLSTSQEFITNNIKLIEVELLLKANNLSVAKEKFEQLPSTVTQGDLAVNYSLLSVFYYASIKEYNKSQSLITSSFENNAEAKNMAKYSLAKVYFSHENFELAHNTLVTLLNDEQSILKKQNYLADIIGNYSVQSRYSDAISFLKEQINKDTSIPQFQQQLAELYLISGRVKAAENQLKLVINNFPDYVPSYIVYARYLMNKKRKIETVDFFNVAVEKHPKTAELWLSFAEYYSNNNQEEMALKTLEKAISKNEGNPLLTFELAVMYDKQSLYLRSEPLYIKVLQNYPEYLPALDNLASNYFTLDKKIDLAIVLAKRAYSLSPNDIFIKNLRAQAYILEKQNTDAITLILPVIDEFKDSGLGHYTLANAYKNTDEIRLAHQHLSMALKSDLPKNIKKKALALQGKWNKANTLQ